MKHTSINLSEDHAARIEATGKSPSLVIRESLDRYFNPPPSALELIQEHVRLYHMPEIEHKERMVSSEPQPIHKNMPVKAHISRMDMPEKAHDLSMKALEYILEELKAGREPIPFDVATKLNTTTQALGKALSPLGIKARETRRAGIAGRYYTFDMKESIEKVVKGDLTE
jgi:hypothetical protein